MESDRHSDQQTPYNPIRDHGNPSHSAGCMESLY